MYQVGNRFCHDHLLKNTPQNAKISRMSTKGATWAVESNVELRARGAWSQNSIPGTRQRLSHTKNQTKCSIGGRRTNNQNADNAAKLYSLASPPRMDLHNQQAISNNIRAHESTETAELRPVVVNHLRKAAIRFLFLATSIGPCLAVGVAHALGAALFWGPSHRAVDPYVPLI